MEEQLSLDFLRVVENAAVAAARTMGFGDRHKADEVAVEAMRKTMDSVEIDRSEEHTSELQSRRDLVCRLLLEKKKKKLAILHYRSNNISNSRKSRHHYNVHVSSSCDS